MNIPLLFPASVRIIVDHKLDLFAHSDMSYICSSDLFFRKQLSGEFGDLNVVLSQKHYTFKVAIEQ